MSDNDCQCELCVETRKQKAKNQRTSELAAPAGSAVCRHGSPLRGAVCITCIKDKLEGRIEQSFNRAFITGFVVPLVSWAIGVLCGAMLFR